MDPRLADNPSIRRFRRSPSAAAPLAVAALVALLMALMPAAAQAAPGTPPAATAAGKTGGATLVVTVGGLPVGSRVKGSIRGPGIARRLTAPRTVLPGVDPGTYTVRLARTRVRRSRGPVEAGALVLPSLSGGHARIRVREGRRAELAARYGSIVNPGIRTLPPSAVSAVEGPADDPTALVLAGEEALRPGAILSLPASRELPRGLLKRIVAVDPVGGQTRARLAAISPFAVVPVGEFSVPMQVQGEGRGARVSAASCGGVSGLDPYRRIRDVRFDGSWNTTRILGQEIKTGVRAKVEFTVDAGFKVSAGVGVECRVAQSFSINGMAGPVPVTAAIEGELSGFAGVGARLTAGGSARVALGVATVGTVPYPTASVGEPRFTLDVGSFAEARAGIGLGTKLGIGNDNLASVTAKFSNSIDFTAKYGSCSWDANFGQFSAQGKIWKFGIESPKTPSLLTKNLWQQPCGPTAKKPGAGGGGGGGAPGGGGPGPAGPAPATSIATGLWHSCARVSDGRVKCWGLNRSGQLGNGTLSDSATPVVVSGIANAVSVAAGADHTCALLSGGGVKCWGDNFYSELGDGTRTNSTTPVPVSGIGNATAITAGWGHTCALLSGGGIKCWGLDTGGQVGNGVALGSPTPQSVSGIGNATAVAAGSFHTCALLSGGGLKCWGENATGQLGTGTAEGPEGCYSFELPCSTVPVSVSGIVNATGIAGGGGQTGEVGHTCAVLADGGVKCWGFNSYGQLGVGTTEGPETCHISIEAPCSAVPVPVVGIGDATAVAAGGDHVCALLPGAVRCWGANGFQQLGDGTTTDRPAPVTVDGIGDATAVAAGQLHTCALLSGGGVKCWGANFFGQLGNGGTPESTGPVAVIGIP